MPSSDLKRLVVNASIAGAAGGEDATVSVSINCTVFLETFRDECPHHIVMTPELSEEWNAHQSMFAARWLKSMIARKRFNFVEPEVDREMRDKIERTATRENEVELMRKDFHLLEAARETDHTIISLDETVRGCFARATRRVGEIQHIVWVNPEHTEEEPLVWLQNGAPPDEHRQLRTWAHTLP